MGIEPTEPFSRKDPTGFEDQAEHQLGCTPVWGCGASAAWAPPSRALPAEWPGSDQGDVPNLRDRVLPRASGPALGFPSKPRSDKVARRPATKIKEPF